jgi:hypothetical protein
MSATSQPVTKLLTAQSCAPSRSDATICSCSSGARPAVANFTHGSHDVGRLGGVEHERLGQDGDVVAKDRGDLVGVARAPEVAE